MTEHNGFRQPSRKMLRIVQTFVNPLMDYTSEQLHFESLSLPSDSDVAMSYRWSSCQFQEVWTLNNIFLSRFWICYNSLRGWYLAARAVKSGGLRYGLRQCIVVWLEVWWSGFFPHFSVSVSHPHEIVLSNTSSTTNISAWEHHWPLFQIVQHAC